MRKKNEHPEHLGSVEQTLRATNPDLPHRGTVARQLTGAPRIHRGVDSDRTCRRQFPADASDILRCLGYTVDLEPGRDVYDVRPVRPISAHDRMRMLQRPHAACAQKR